MSRRKAPPGPPATEIPSYWFVLMESAKERGDFEAAAHAKHELERLGVRVIYGRPQPAPCGGPTHAA